MHDRLTSFEKEILRKIHMGQALAVSSMHRVRLEFAGAIREGAKGLALTEHGLKLAFETARANGPGEDPDTPPVHRDSRGRRMPFQRQSVFKS
jgi:hypothetical protein